MRVTPAMAAGFTTRVWSVADLVALLPVQTGVKRGPYRKGNSKWDTTGERLLWSDELDEARRQEAAARERAEAKAAEEVRSRQRAEAVAAEERAARLAQEERMRAMEEEIERLRGKPPA